MPDIRAVTLVEAGHGDMALVQDMMRFYIYAVGSQIGPDADWVGERTWFQHHEDIAYAWEDGNHPFLIEADGMLAGFCLIDRYALVPGIDWNMSQFFVMGPFAGLGVGRRATILAFDRFPGVWQVTQIPENTAAVSFWRSVIHGYTHGAFEERMIPNPKRDNEPRNVMTFTAPPLMQDAQGA